MTGWGFITKEDLEKEIARILKNADLEVTTMKNVRQQLEKRFGIDLTDKRMIIRQLVFDYIDKKKSK